MLPAANRGDGAFEAAPDICLTPPPLPYTDVAANVLASTFSPNIFLVFIPALFQTSQTESSTGDELGELHWTTEGFAVVTEGLFQHVLFNFLPAAHLNALTAGNQFNAPEGTIAQPSSVNTVIGCAPPPSAAGDTTGAEDPLAVDDPSRPSVEVGPLLDGEATLVVRVFAVDVAARVHGALRRLREQGLRSLVIDLSGCRGGDVGVAVELAGDFLPDGAHVLTLLDEDGDETTYRARGPVRWDLPLRVRVDAGTASAAEIFTEAMRANGRADIVGGPTYGKRVATTAVRGGGVLRARWSCAADTTGTTSKG